MGSVRGPGQGNLLTRRNTALGRLPARVHLARARRNTKHRPSFFLTSFLHFSMHNLRLGDIESHEGRNMENDTLS